jgi:hypothetical protein
LIQVDLRLTFLVESTIIAVGKGKLVNLSFLEFLVGGIVYLVQSYICSVGSASPLSTVGFLCFQS